MPQRPGLARVWAASPSEQWAVGSEGLVAHVVKGRVSEQTVGARDLKDVWGSSPSDVWAVGVLTVLHYDGQAWTATDSSSHLDGVWGSGPTDVWAVGSAGTILHFDGQAWAPMKSGASHDLHGVWGTGPTDVWAAGSAGTLLHYDGSAWKAVPSTTSLSLARVWASGPSDAWAGGATDTFGGLILHWDGAAWSAIDRRALALGAIVELWGTGPGDVWFIGGTSIVHYDGQTFSNVSSTPGVSSLRTAGSSLWAVDSNGGVSRLEGDLWVPLLAGGLQLWAVWGSGPTDVWAVGSAGVILHFDGKAWSFVPSGLTTDLLSVWGTGPADVWAGGSTLLHFDGSTWAPAGAPSGTVLGLCGLGSSASPAAWAVGNELLTLDAQTQQWALAQENVSLEKVWCDPAGGAWAAGGSGVVHLLNPTDRPRSETLPLEAPENALYSAVWGSGSELWAGSQSGALLHFDGAGWSLVDTSIVADLWGTGTSDVWVVGDRIRHFDGQSWKEQVPRSSLGWNAVWGTGNEVWAVGSNRIAHLHQP